MFGNAGNEQIFGFDGNDGMSGGSGNDNTLTSVDGKRINDKIDGGSGTDTYQSDPDPGVNCELDF